MRLTDWRLHLFLICGFGSLFSFIAGIDFLLPYILSFAWIYNPEAIAPLPYWYAVPCFVISFVLFEVTLRLYGRSERNDVR